MINAESEAEVRAGYNLLNGELYKKVAAMQNNLTNTLAEIEVAIDYPEHDIEYATIEKFKNYHLAKGTLSANWNASFTTWLINADAYQRRDNPKPTNKRMVL